MTMSIETCFGKKCVLEDYLLSIHGKGSQSVLFKVSPALTMTYL